MLRWLRRRQEARRLAQADGGGLPSAIMAPRLIGRLRSASVTTRLPVMHATLAPRGANAPATCPRALCRRAGSRRVRADEPQRARRPLQGMRFDEGPVVFAPRRSLRLSREPAVHRSTLCAGEHGSCRLRCWRRRSWVRPPILPSPQVLRPMMQGRFAPSNRALPASSSPVSADDWQAARREGPSGSGTIRRSSCWLCWRVYLPPSPSAPFLPRDRALPPLAQGFFFVRDSAAVSLGKNARRSRVSSSAR
jgi:hypothetical protein